MKLLARFLITTVAILITTYLLDGIYMEGVGIAIIVAIVLGIINILIKPILVILTLPVTVMTLGLFLLVINALMIMLTAWLVPGFAVDNFWWALLFSIVLAIISWFLNQFID
ncbi:MAG: phage holin family protein [Candidatus Cyclobacteriaceae bacterium M2_1C_046]